MLGSDHPTGRRSFVLAWGCFAVAGLANAGLDADGRSVLAAASAVAGTYFVARYAGRVSRRRLATVSLGLWLAFLAIAGGHALGHIGISAVDVVPMAASAVDVVATTRSAVAVDAVTWATLLGAGTTTIFLAFREYGSERVADAAEERVVEGDAEY